MQNVKLIAHTPDPERVVAAAARLCYSAVGVDALLEAQTPEKNTKFVKMLASMGHESPIEHVSFTFAVEGVSRSLLAQITRHRIASFSVQSQRYVRLDDFQFVVPPEIEADPASKELFLEAMKKQGEEHLALAASLQARHKAELMAQGLDEKTADRKAEKMANEDARFVLPNACETKLVMTMNAR
ncbi:MAG: FAD-dependent thymidylate synthase, partial [Clostridiales bacterium]|nr:FAD-dependent thymidylate synthase [Clostridiales bacterium]